MQGYRKNVAMVVLNKNNHVLLCRRKGAENWQFPQGGIDENEKFNMAFLETIHNTGLNYQGIIDYNSLVEIFKKKDISKLAR